MIFFIYIFSLQFLLSITPEEPSVASWPWTMTLITGEFFFPTAYLLHFFKGVPHLATPAYYCYLSRPGVSRMGERMGYEVGGRKKDKGWREYGGKDLTLQSEVNQTT